VISFGATDPGAESWWRLGGLAVALSLGARHGRIPFRLWLGRSLLLLPFAACVAAAKLVILVPGSAPGVPLGGWTLAAAPGGGEEALRLLARAWLCILATLLLAATTPFAAVLAVLGRARFPRGFLEATSLVHRYLWVLLSEGRRLLLARRLRTGRAPPWRSGGRILATLFARSLSRAQRIEVALRLRGYRGELPLGRRLEWTARDSRRLLVAGVVLAAAVLGPRLGGGSG